MITTKPKSAALLATILFCASTLLADPAHAQGCTEVRIPFSDFRFAGVTGASNRIISADGRQVLLQAIPENAPESAGAEVVLFNPFDGSTRQLTTGTQATVTAGTGTLNRYPRGVSGISADGRRVYLTSTAASSFNVLNRPGAPSQQEEVLIGDPGPAEILDLQTNQRTPLRTLDISNLGPNQVYSAAITAQSADGNLLLLSEGILNLLDYTDPNGRNFRIVVSRSAAVAGLYDIRDGTYTDVVSRIVAATGIPNFLPQTSTGAQYLMSGDANAFAFQSNINLLDPQRRTWAQTPGNINGIANAAYVYYRDLNRIELIGAPDLAGPARPPAASTQVFVRNIGNTGRRFAFDRGVPWLGAERNPTWQATPALAEVGQNVRYIVPPLPQLPDRGIFSHSLAYISKNERYLYFTHTTDLVPGLNPARSQELFRFDIQTNQIRQISRFQDDLFARFGPLLQSPNLNGTYQISVQDSSESDERVIAYTRAGFISLLVTSRDASGRVVVSNSSARTPRDAFRIAVCN